MNKTLHGKVHGKTIELDEDLGVAEGQEVEVQVTVIPKSARKTGEGFLRTEGALADDEEWDANMEEIHIARVEGERWLRPEPVPFDPTRIIIAKSGAEQNFFGRRINN